MFHPVPFKLNFIWDSFRRTGAPQARKDAKKTNESKHCEKRNVLFRQEQKNNRRLSTLSMTTDSKQKAKNTHTQLQNEFSKNGTDTLRTWM